MTCAQHLIENAIYSKINGRDHSVDQNSEYTKCTIEEANEMAEHILYSLYNGMSPEDLNDLEEEIANLKRERDAAANEIAFLSFEQGVY